MKKGDKSSVMNPWEVKGNVDYAKLIKEFGVSPMPSLPKIFDGNVLFRRKTIFAQREFSKIIEAINGKKEFVMMTGLMPSGKFHLGHMILAEQMIFYQKLGAKLYIAVADLEAYNTRKKSLKELRKIAIEEYITNYVALGLDLKKCDIYFQSDRSEERKKSSAYYSLASNFSRYATFNEFKGVYGNISPGKMNASLLQAADMYHPQLPEFEGKSIPTFIPVGIDQDPHIRIARDIAKRNKDHKFSPIASTYHLFFPSLKGNGKMSSSDENSFIALTDSPKEVENKIKKYAFSGGKDTLAEHKKHGGNPDVDVSFQYLKMFFEPNDKKLDEIYRSYKSGEMTTQELKSYTIEKINAFLSQHQKRRKLAEKEIGKFLRF